MEGQDLKLFHGRGIFLYLSVYNMLIFNVCLADKYKNMSLQAPSLKNMVLIPSRGACTVYTYILMYVTHLHGCCS